MLVDVGRPIYIYLHDGVLGSDLLQLTKLQGTVAEFQKKPRTRLFSVRKNGARLLPKV